MSDKGEKLFTKADLDSACALTWKHCLSYVSDRLSVRAGESRFRQLDGPQALLAVANELDNEWDDVSE